MKNTEIFYFDVDGTLFDNETQTVSEKTKLALKKLQENNYKVALSTGRTLGSVLGSGIENLVPWDAFVLANGGIIMDKDFKMIENIVCEPDFIKELIRIYPEPIVLEGDEIYISKEINPRLEKFLFESDVDVPPVLNYTDEAFQKIILEDINLIEDGFDNIIFKDYDYDLNTSQMYEIYPKQSGKHNAIKKYNEREKIKSFSYFGDGHNDVGAIKLADFGVAMGNANEHAKAVADYVTDSVSEDGIYNALKHFELI